MATIGTFTAEGSEYMGTIATLTIRASDVRIVPTTGTSDTGPATGDQPAEGH